MRMTGGHTLLEDRRVEARQFNLRGGEVARLREALTVKPSPRLHVEGAIPV
jgi:hypothetical protein